MAEAQYPKVSIIMPTLNAGALLDNCLASIAAQSYPRDRIEIILADAYSKDATRDIARKYGARVLDVNGKNMEEGKRLALAHASGEYIVFVDADNEFTHPDFLELAVRALEKNPQALGVESYYLPSAKMSSFCAYVTHRLHISDPICWIMSANPILVAREGEIERWTLPKESFSYPLGANGFVFRRADLDSVKANEHFQDTHVALHLMKAGKREWLRLRGRGVHHYYVQTWWGFLQKRRRATVLDDIRRVEDGLALAQEIGILTPRVRPGDPRRASRDRDPFRDLVVERHRLATAVGLEDPHLLIAPARRADIRKRARADQLAVMEPPANK